MSEGAQQSGQRQLSSILGRGPEVLVQAPRFALRVRANILGCVAGQYVVLRPFRGNARPGLSALTPSIGDELIVRLFVDGMAYGFTASVILVLSYPEPLVFLHYPETVERISVRQDMRLPCRLPCVLVESGGERQAALLLDISEHGAQVACRGLVAGMEQLGRPVTLELTLPALAGAREGAREITGKITRVTEQRQVRCAGIKFDRSYAEWVDSLASYLNLGASQDG